MTVSSRGPIGKSSVPPLSAEKKRAAGAKILIETEGQNISVES